MILQEFALFVAFLPIKHAWGREALWYIESII
jgi:hypothetical protein